MKRFLKRLLCLALCAALCLSAAACSDKTDDASEEGYANTLFDTGRVHTVNVVISEADWADLRANPLEKTKYKVDVEIDGETVEQVSFATKGNTSLSSVAGDPDSDRYSFKINFGKYVKGQTYRGLNKLSLNNLYADATFMKDYLSYEIFRRAGVNAPLVSYVWLTVNGQDHGLYIAIEDMSESYLERTVQGEGVLYKPETEQLANMAEPHDGQPGQGGPGQRPTPPEGGTPGESGQMPTPLEGGTPGESGQGGPGAQGGPGGQPGGQGGPGFGGSAKGADLVYSDDETDSYTDIFDNNETKAEEADQKRVIAALKQLSEGGDYAACLDTEEVIRYFAAHNFVLNYDSYTGNMLHNYFLYENDGRLSMLPWDYNLAFGAFAGGMGGGKDATALVNTGIDTPLSGASEQARPMWSWIVSDEQWLGQYHAVYDELLSSYFESGEFEKQIDKLYGLLKPYVEKDPSAFYTAEEYDAACQTLKQFCLLRSQSIRAQLSGSLSPRTDEQDQTARVDAGELQIDTMGSQGGPGGQGGPGWQPGGRGGAN